VSRSASIVLSFCFGCVVANGAVIYSFQTLNNNADPTFNQLLGVNNGGSIAGYFGSGSAAHPNQGYTVTLFNGHGSFTNENFPASTQTQVVGINNNSSPATVGFWVDGNGNNFGFVDRNNVFTTVVDPLTNMNQFNQLLGVNDANVAAGFYVDDNGNANAYLYNIGTMAFTSLILPTSFNAVAATATGINDAGVVTGFYTDADGNTHGFIDNGGTFTSLDDQSPGAQNTMLLGINNHGQAVGSYVNALGVTSGLIFNSLTNTWTTITDPNASANAAFDVTGTTVNGINDNGTMVGFYSDGTNINGFVAIALPEPSTVSLLILGGCIFGLGLIRSNSRRRR